MKVKSSHLFLVLTLISLFTVTITAQVRGVGVRVKTANGEEKEVQLYRGSYALLIGNSDYTDGWSNLPGVKSDIVAVKATLEKQGFKVEVAENLTNRQFDSRMKQFIDDYGFEPHNRLLIYFAGHGHTMKSAGDSREFGYIVPVDASDPAKNELDFRRKAISMDTILNYAKEIQSKHALFIFDSCFSGKLVSRDRAIVPPIIEESIEYPVRQFITAGAANQPVPDESIFRRAFVRGLEGEADRNRDGYITGSELADYLREKVTNYSERKQTPLYNKINDIDLDRGDFVFSLKSPAPSENQATATSTTAYNKTIEAQALAEKALAQLVAGNNDEALNLATKSIELDNNIPLAYAVRGRLYDVMDEDKKAENDLNRAISLNPNSGLANSFLSVLYHNQSFSESSKADLSKKTAEKALQLLNQPDGVIEIYARGIVYNMIQNSQQAIAEFTKVIDLHPRFALVYNNRGSSYDNKKEYDLAIQDFTKAIELNPKFKMAYNSRGVSYNNKKEYDLAIRDYTKAIELDPKYVFAYNNRGSSYNRKKEFTKALTDLNKAIELDPKFTNAYWIRGTVYRDMNKHTEALADYTKAIELNQNNESVFVERGDIYYNQKDYNRAIQDYDKAINLNPKYSHAYNKRGLSYYFKKEDDLAIRDFTKAIELDPISGAAYYNRGSSYFYKKEYNLAIQDYTKYISMEPKDPDGYKQRANAYEKLGKSDLAEADRRKYRELGGQ